jgi:hypothetical protein
MRICSLFELRCEFLFHSSCVVVDFFLFFFFHQGIAKPTDSAALKNWRFCFVFASTGRKAPQTHHQLRLARCSDGLTTDHLLELRARYSVPSTQRDPDPAPSTQCQCLHLWRLAIGRRPGQKNGSSCRCRLLAAMTTGSWQLAGALAFSAFRCQMYY